MMKNVTKSMLSALAIAGLLAAGSIAAREHGEDRDWHRGPPSAEKQLAHISGLLELSDDQSTELLAILQEAEKSRQALHDQTMALMGAEICAQKVRTEEAILSILDEEQAELFLQMKADREERGRERTASRKGRGGPDCSDYEEDA